MASVVAGAELGGEIGALGGPLGAAAGAVIGAVVGLGILLVAGNRMSDASSDADSSLSDEPIAEACADCGDGPDCFEPPEGADPEEFARQLQEQESAINKLSPDQMLERLAEGDTRKAATGSYRGAGNAAARAAARTAAKDAAWRQAYTAAKFAGRAEGEALAAAKAAAQAAVAGQDATDALDWVAGGDGAISGMGDRSVNRSIGPQWANRKASSQLTRREQLRSAAEKAKRQGKSKMDVNLEEC